MEAAVGYGGTECVEGRIEDRAEWVSCLMLFGRWASRRLGTWACWVLVRGGLGLGLAVPVSGSGSGFCGSGIRGLRSISEKAWHAVVDPDLE